MLKWKDVTGQVKAAALEGLKDGGEHILDASNQKVPVEEGTLLRSGRVTVDGDTVIVSYDTPYAVRQHEDTHLHHVNGQAKFLESAANEQADKVQRLVAEAIQGEIGG